MEVTLDARLTKQMSAGMKLYVRELVQRLPPAAPDLNFVIVSNAAFDAHYENVQVVSLTADQAANGGVAEQCALPRRLAATRARLIHFMSVYAPRLSRLPHVYTIHDLIHLRFPRYFSWKVPPYYALVVKPVARSSSFLLTDAKATVADLQHYLGVRREQVRVVPLAAGDEFYVDEAARGIRAARARRRFSLDRPYFLYVGNHRAHKNLECLARAWYELEQTCDLVITEEGGLGFSIDASRGNGRIKPVGRVEQSALVDLYAGCVAAVQPSLYEGFGLTVLEAMAAGAPSIVAQTPALIEVGGDAVLTFTSDDSSSLARQMEQILSDGSLRARLREAGRQRATNFSWDETAKRTAAVYREALASHA